MTKDEALKLALEALEEHHYGVAQIIIREALAQPERLAELGWQEIDCPICGGGARAFPKPEQEPVAWYRDEDGIRIYYESKVWDDATPLYSTPPQRTWVGLTDGEISQLWISTSPYFNEDDFARAIEAKLKEKNNG